MINEYDRGTRRTITSTAMIIGTGQVSRAPLAKLQAYKQRTGWTFPWASSYRSEFNFDFCASVTEEQQRAGGTEYNFRTFDEPADLNFG